MNATRRSQIAEGLTAARERIADACRLASRPVDSVRLVVVTKTFPASDVLVLQELGCTDVGENRDQEARAKRAELASSGDGLRWHMIGQLQRNKARSVAQWADVVESVDRLELALAVARAAQSAGRVIDILIQVALDPEPVPGRGGAHPAAVPELAMAASALPGLRLAGVMGVAPLGGDPDDAFARLADVSGRVQASIPTATEISAGMSGDFERAIAHGATQIRLGGAILGNRPPLG